MDGKAPVDQDSLTTIQGQGSGEMYDPGAMKALVGAVIERAVLDCAGVLECHPSDERRVRREGRRWLYDWHPGDTETPWTFPWCCQTLDLCPFDTRRNVSRYMGQGKTTRGRGEYRQLFFANVAESATEQEVYFL